MSTVRARTILDDGEPAWEVAHLFPLQGSWTEEEYLALPGNRLVEYSNGRIEVLPMPTMSHQLMVAFLYGAVLAFVQPQNLGTVLFSGLRVRLWKGKIREPDVVFMLASHADRMGEVYWKGADLVMEVVSGGDEDRERDLVTKVKEYARARIPEYWIVDPVEAQVTVLRLKGRKYVVHGKIGRGSRATSVLLKGFAVEVDGMFAGKRGGRGRR